MTTVFVVYCPAMEGFQGVAFTKSAATALRDRYCCENNIDSSEVFLLELKEGLFDYKTWSCV